jgi:hypothetical protein
MTLRRFLFLFYFIFVSLGAAKHRPIVMLDPAGHARDEGRKLRSEYERGATFRFAEELRKALEKKYDLKVLLTRDPGEVVQQYQNASFSNRVSADLFLRLQLYRENDVKPTISIYHLVFNSLVDFAHRSYDSLVFIPLREAHFQNIHRTKQFGNKLAKALSEDGYQRNFDCNGLVGLPLKDLIGIQAPALTIECGIYNDNQWQQLIEPLVESFSTVLGSLEA